MPLKQSASAPWRRSVRFLLKGQRLPTALGLLVTVCVLWFFATSQPAVNGLRQRLDHLVYDLRFSFMLEPPVPLEHSIVIVDYDEKSLEVEGQWPWSRFKIGDMVERLRHYGALVIGFDVFFPEYERNLVTELQQRIARDDARAALLPDLAPLQEVLDGDRYFAAKMEGVDVVLGIFFERGSERAKGVLPDPLLQIDETLMSSLTLPRMRGYTANVDILQHAASGAGFFDLGADLDGVLRRYPLVRLHAYGLYPSLALEMARLYLFEEDFSLAVEADARGRFQAVTGVAMGSVHLPTDASAQVLVPYGGPSGAFPYISATDVLNDSLSDEQEALLRNSLVLVGSTSAGLFDLHATPIQEAFPGVEVHATVLRAILSASPSMETGEAAPWRRAATSPFPAKPDWESGAVFVFLLLLGVLLSAVWPRLGPAWLSVSGLGLMLGLVVLNFHLWRAYGLDLSLVAALFLVLLLTLLNMANGFLREGASRRAITGMFGQYVPPAHIEAMLDDPGRYDFEGESKELSVLFADIRGFTTISESLGASQLKRFLNDYFTPITGVIFEHQGTIDKYVGDMVIAFWGAPLDDPDHRRHAVAAALAMLDKVEELKAEFRARGLPELEIGIGVNSGMMNVGDMGSAYRRAYTVLGDAVNLGARLEGLTSYYGVRCLIGEATHEALENFLCREIDRVRVRGRERPVRIYEPLCREEEAGARLRARLDAHHAALECYRRQRWDEAESALRQLEKTDPASCTLYRVYLDRIATLREHDPGRDWDASFRHNSR